MNVTNQIKKPAPENVSDAGQYPKNPIALGAAPAAKGYVTVFGCSADPCKQLLVESTATSYHQPSRISGDSSGGD